MDKIYQTSAEEVERRKRVFSAAEMRQEIERIKDECVIGSPFTTEATRHLVEFMVVYGEIACSPRLTVDEFSVDGFAVVDPITITRIIGPNNETPQPPSPAYQQIWHGKPMVNMTTNDLLLIEFTNIIDGKDQINAEAVKENLKRIKREFDEMVSR